MSLRFELEAHQSYQRYLQAEMRGILRRLRYSKPSIKRFVSLLSNTCHVH